MRARRGRAEAEQDQGHDEAAARMTADSPQEWNA
jgi:hypothetical protein